MQTLYRVCNPGTNNGLWYDQDGKSTGLIHRLNQGQAQSRDLPMDFDPDCAGGWESATDKIEDLTKWFSRTDIEALSQIGYVLHEVHVMSFKVGVKYGHPLFHRDAVNERRVLPFTVLDFSKEQ